MTKKISLYCLSIMLIGTIPDITMSMDEFGISEEPLPATEEEISPQETPAETIEALSAQEPLPETTTPELEQTLTIPEFVSAQSITTPEKSEKTQEVPAPLIAPLKMEEQDDDEPHHYRRKKDPTITFAFENTDLVKIINEYAAKKGLNILLPQGAQAINQKITFKLPRPVSLNQAKTYIDMFLDLAGYSMRPQGAFYRITKNDANSTREPLPLFINIKSDDLPLSDERIRAVFYLNTLKVPESKQAPDPINLILRDMLSAGDLATWLFDQKSNSIIITDKANSIASAMKVIAELDTYGSREMIEVIRLHNHTASIAASFLAELIKGSAPAAKPGSKSESENYFTNSTRVVPDDRTNSLIIMGKESAVNRLKEFVYEIVDTPEDSGKSILHVYELQYLDADEFASVLASIVKPIATASQSTKEPGGGPERFFEGVIIKAERKSESKADAIAGGKDGAKTESVFKGGNRLIIAAKQDDFIKIRDIIKQLDEPQPQVICEVMITDLSFESNRILAAQMRDPANYLPNGVNVQAAQATAPILGTDGSGSVVSIVPDLLKLVSGSSAAVGLSTGTNAGSMILSFNDPAGTGIWGLLQILRDYGQVRVLSHPFLVVRNNTKAEEILSDIRRDQGDATTSEGGVAIAKRVDISASLKIAVVPRISSRDRLALQLSIDIDDFRGNATNAPRNTRRIQTNVNISSGQVLILGGLTRLEESDSVNETPLLGKIPILGWLFRRSAKTMIRNNLAVFITPTIVFPRFRDGQNTYTGNKIERGYTELSDGVIFDNLRDPINHFFFNALSDNNETLVDGYLTQVKDTGVVKKGLEAKKKREQRFHSRYPKNRRKAKKITNKQDQEALDDRQAKADKIKQRFAKEENPLIMTTPAA